MPLTHVRTFRVRHYECDTQGQVNQATYLRYMQEAAFDASAAAGYDLGRYQAMGRYWLVRETEIQYLRPLRYGDRVQVKTWVADFRRVRSRRAYEFRLAGTDELVAHAQTDWAYLDLARGRPLPIPPEMKAAFFPEGAPATAPARERFPAASPPPDGGFRTWRRVERRDLDPAGHVNNAVYVAFIEECGWQMFAAHGWPLARIQPEGLAVVTRHHRIEYRQPAMLGDELELCTWISDVKRTTAVRHSTIKRTGDGALLLRARTVHAWADLQHGGPVAIPGAFVSDLAPASADTELTKGRTR
jgi:acyl-CoA thioester hydrolase